VAQPSQLEKPGRRQASSALRTPQGPHQIAILGRLDAAAAPGPGTGPTARSGDGLGRGGSESDEMDVGVAMHNEADVGREAARGARVTAIGILDAVSTPMSTQL